MSKKSVSENIVYVIKLLNFQRYRVCHDAVLGNRKLKTNIIWINKFNFFSNFTFNPDHLKSVITLLKRLRWWLHGPGLVCWGEISTRPVETDFIYNYMGKSNFIPAWQDSFSPGICLVLFTFSMYYSVLNYCFIPLRFSTCNHRT